MNSCLYECRVMHHRFAPKVHHFEHRIFMFYIDLDELDALSKKLVLFSHNQKNLYTFRDSDHEPSGEKSLKQRVIRFLKSKGIELDNSARISVLTLPRIAGYIFNPISIYFCADAHGAPVCAVAEVGNTFREMKLFVIGPNDISDDGFRKIVPKHFYVSPFSSLDLHFDFRLAIPGEKLDIHIDDLDGEEKILISTLTGIRAELSNRNLCWFTLKYPLVTLKVIFLIHWHALILWLKRVPYFRKTENLALQREVLRTK